MNKSGRNQNLLDTVFGFKEKGPAFPSCIATSASSKNDTILGPSSPPVDTANDNGKILSLQESERVQQKQNCDKYISSGLSRNMTVQFLINNLVSMGCTPPEGFIQCIDCGTTMAGGGFGIVEELTNNNNKISGKHSTDINKHERKKELCNKSIDQDHLKAKLQAQKEGKVNLRLLPEIFLCENHLVNEEHAHQSMIHELIHAIDLCRTKMDPINNCIHMACTEIRAENLSGECSWLRELGAGRIGQFRGHGAECVKRRAILSVKANPNCKEKAAEYVDAAFDRCFKDTYPFDRHPNLR